MTASHGGSPQPVPVVIIGAGPAGIAAATLLGQYGVECLVLDRHETVYPLPRAVHADDEVYRILARLGIGDEFTAHRRPAAGLRLIDPNMRVLSEIPRSTTPSANGYAQMNMFDQPELEAMLRANLTRYPQVSLRGDVEVTSVTQTRPGLVRVSFLDRVRGGEHSVQANYVLGCDGANSPTRAAIGAHMYGLPFTQDWLVIDVNTDAELHQWEGCHQLCSPQRAGTYMRVGETRYRWEFQLVDGETVADYQTLADIEPLVRPWLGDTSIDELELVRVTAYTFRAQVANRWRDRNVFLLGDAAHLTPPFVGQGMAAGLRDAMNLTWKLVGLLDGTLPDSVLDTYEQERKLHAAAMILMAVSVGAAMTGGGRAGDVIRRVVFPHLQKLRLPGSRFSAAEGVAPGLRRSELVIKPRTPGGLAGTLCPNPVLAEGLRFDDVVGNRFTLVTSTPLTEAQRDELSRRGAAVIQTAAGSDLDRWLLGGRATAAIVRPDRTVMQAGRNTEAICDALPVFTPAAGLNLPSSAVRTDHADA
ncbi:bifunctional 3-(3-hydroxy-phenyl)propionate/3-hydroxycinnamic acid hydroxylase [Mycobacterium sp. CBMA293]|uniref:bifunctional 3-(3-hydroxy-phenyl)propionate/3-hydroxycinnamic acid hydroxylase MhpA n=1 Tax=unclassified Mycolicibacterium TaxID=2636767 RepID=UPI0012DF853B|nr:MULTISPECIES: bifunctional 3-(3-hydroxy-phenyl)propionate/3-hydroxycinnamic acid hydroxylase [unclassified Mycolicibacterium]MUL47098.1 bifunctional 3-(3-hydroxy-phenyl)propionate/3-hydroxycinnamic acid hydroxylase [Mycolicibacterium sp. CBMA 360]MUL58475.1 bifunctional 3-(3-hydroxy-phenyl)propionate/3-hydroxycinnamic acid hydroxylase [Mycolicibacterium sp. CBMA 335]MUL73933.1 bifunctional 3-(3-hydroxy-phenyl)propionate/3-hydroxycinnamic acid hydroxylase [Mycolicibacterium sp. CBMA 311]MUL93